HGAGRSARSRFVDPHGWGAADQQLPAVEPCLHRALFLRRAVAGFRRGGARGRNRALWTSTTSLRFGALPSGGALMLKQRVMTALALAAVALIVIFLLPHAAMKAALALLVVAGAWEWSVFRGAASGAARLAYAALIALGVAIVWHLDHLGVRLEAVLYAALVWWI